MFLWEDIKEKKWNDRREQILVMKLRRGKKMLMMKFRMRRLRRMM